MGLGGMVKASMVKSGMSKAGMGSMDGMVGGSSSKASGMMPAPAGLSKSSSHVPPSFSSKSKSAGMMPMAPPAVVVKAKTASRSEDMAYRDRRNWERPP